MYKIPFNPEKAADQALQVLVPEVSVLSLRLLWNGREESWHLDVEVGEKAIHGVRLVQGSPLLYNLGASSPLPGDFIVLPATRDPGPLSYESLGSSYELFYMMPDDVAEWEAAHGMG